MKHYFQRLQNAVSENWDRKALCDYGGCSFTFGEMAGHIEKLHMLFESIGICKGDRIALCSRNQARWGICFFAANTYEAVAVPVLTDFTPENISSIIDHSGSVLLFADRDIWDELKLNAMPSLRHVLCVSDFTLLYGSPEDVDALLKLDSTFSGRYPSGLRPTDICYPMDNDKNLAVINYTSGSTGDPKGVMIRYESLSANIEFAQNHIPTYPGDRLLSILPMAHMFGMVFEMIYPICGGVTVYFLGKTPSPTLLMRAMQEVRPYLAIAVPMVFEKIYRSRLKPMSEKPLVKFLRTIPGVREIIHTIMRKSIDRAFGGSVREYVMGGAGINPEVEEFLRCIGLHYTVGYGMTEAAPLLAYTSWDTFALHSCGRVMDFVTLRINSDDPQNKVGEIQARGVNIFSGYYKNEQATKAAFTEDGWFSTGDLGVIDAEGNVFIKGRSKSMLLSSNGQNIYPEEIECEINNIPYVSESLVVSRNGLLVALVYPDDLNMKSHGMTACMLAEEIKRAVNARMPKYSLISGVEIMAEPFLKTPKMSIKRFLYR